MNVIDNVKYKIDMYVKMMGGKGCRTATSQVQFPKLTTAAPEPFDWNLRMSTTERLRTRRQVVYTVSFSQKLRRRARRS